MLINHNAISIIRGYKYSKKVFDKNLSKYPIDIPVIIRGIYSNRAIVHECRETGRDFYLLDTGYIGNQIEHKHYHRIVKNGFLHSHPINVSKDRYKQLADFIYKTYGKLDYVHQQGIKYPFYNKQWNKNGKNILIIESGYQSSKYNNIIKDQWLNETILTLRQYTNRKIIVRKKPNRSNRIGNNSIYNQLVNDDIFAVIVLNSIVAVEAIMFGIPVFSLLSTPVSHLSSNDFSKIETPYYPPRTEVIKTLYWLTYCQYTKQEIESGYAFELIQKYDLK